MCMCVAWEGGIICCCCMVHVCIYYHSYCRCRYFPSYLSTVGIKHLCLLQWVVMSRISMHAISVCVHKYTSLWLYVKYDDVAHWNVSACVLLACTYACVHSYVCERGEWVRESVFVCLSQCVCVRACLCVCVWNLIHNKNIMCSLCNVTINTLDSNWNGCSCDVSNLP